MCHVVWSSRRYLLGHFLASNRSSKYWRNWKTPFTGGQRLLLGFHTPCRHHLLHWLLWTVRRVDYLLITASRRVKALSFKGALSDNDVRRSVRLSVCLSPVAYVRLVQKIPNISVKIYDNVGNLKVHYRLLCSDVITNLRWPTAAMNIVMPVYLSEINWSDCNVSWCTESNHEKIIWPKFNFSQFKTDVTEKSGLTITRQSDIGEIYRQMQSLRAMTTECEKFQSLKRQDGRRPNSCSIFS